MAMSGRDRAELRAEAHHLTPLVHVGQQHHVDGALYGDINYTEPLLNNLHLVGPSLFAETR